MDFVASVTLASSVKSDPDLEAAHGLVRGTGISVGSYGRG